MSQGKLHEIDLTEKLAKEVDLSKVDINKIPGYEADIPPRRLDEITWFDELEAMWGRKWGQSSKIGKVHSVIMRRPGLREVNNELVRKHPLFFNYSEKGLADRTKIRQEWEGLQKVLLDHGVEVFEVILPDPIIGAYNIPLRSAWAIEIIMIRGGAVIERSAMHYKRGIEVIEAKSLMEIGCPILFQITGSGIFEPRVDYLDPKHALLGYGCRANAEGIRQMEWILKLSGVENIHLVHMPGPFRTKKVQVGGSAGSFHLDCVFSMVDQNLAIIYPGAVGYDTIIYLQNLGIELIEIPEGEVVTFAGNCFPLEPGKVIMATNNPVTTTELRKHGVEVIEVDMTESILKEAIGPDCAVVALEREDGPYLNDRKDA